MEHLQHRKLWIMNILTIIQTVNLWIQLIAKQEHRNYEHVAGEGRESKNKI